MQDTGADRDHGPILEIFEAGCTPGAVVPYRNLELEMEVKNDDAEVWVIRRGGETVTRVNVAKMRVSTQLAQFLDAIADGETPPIGPVCESCPIQSLAGD